VSFHDTIRILLGRAREGDGPLNPVEWRRMQARVARARATADKWLKAQRGMDDRCTEAVERLDEEAFERLCDGEQAKVDPFYKPLRAVIDDDRWPRKLHWGGI
jgi:hypothetical protein